MYGKKLISVFMTMFLFFVFIPKTNAEPEPNNWSNWSKAAINWGKASIGQEYYDKQDTYCLRHVCACYRLPDSLKSEDNAGETVFRSAIDCEIALQNQKKLHNQEYDGWKNAPPGSMLFFRKRHVDGHVVLYLGNGKIIDGGLGIDKPVDEVDIYLERYRGQYSGWAYPYEKWKRPSDDTINKWANSGDSIYPPELESPKHDEVIFGPPIRFIWKSLPSRSYMIEVSKSDSFQNVVFRAYNQSVQWNDAEDNTAYYWRVTDVTNDGNKGNDINSPSLLSNSNRVSETRRFRTAFKSSQDTDEPDTYNRNNALKYANEYWNKAVTDGYYWINPSYPSFYGKGSNAIPSTGYDCAHFVSCCIGQPPDVAAGNLPVPSRTQAYGEPGAKRLADWILNQDNPYGEVKSTINELIPGDVILFNQPFDHIVLYKGNNEYYAHSTNTNNSKVNTGNVSKYIHLYGRSDIQDPDPQDPDPTDPDPPPGFNLPAPNLLSPYNGKQIGVGEKLTWTQVPGKSNYTLKFMDNNHNPFGKIEYPQGEDFTISSDQNFQNGQYYYWKVAGNCANNVASAFSDERAFIFIGSRDRCNLPAPSLISPKYGKEVSVGDRLTWMPVSGKKNYTLVIMDSNNNQISTKIPQAEDFTLSSDQNLHNGQIYFWKVAANCDNNIPSNFSKPEYFTFRDGTIKLGVPQRTSPWDGQKDVILSPLFQWKPITSAISYAISLFQNDRMIWSNITNGYFIQYPGVLSKMTWYQWKIQAIGANNQRGPESNGWSFLTITGEGEFTNIPTRLSPYDGQNDVSRSPTFRWNPLGNVGYYRIWIIASGNTLWERTTTETYVQYPYELADSTWYQWKIQAISSSGKIGPESNGWSFRTEGEIIIPPDPPILQSPTNEATNQSNNVTFSWTKGARATYSHVYVRDVADNNRLIWDSGARSGTSVTIPSGYLSEKKKYTWNMQSSNDAGYSSHTSTWTFYTVGYGVIIRPDIPSRISPADGANNVSCRPTFSWSSTPNATSYYVWLIGGDSIIWETTVYGTSVQYPNELTKYTWYTWKIQAKGSGGNSDQSNGWSFRTEGEIIIPPDPPILQSPTNEATNQSNNVTFSWTKGARATYSHVYVRDVADNNRLIWDSGARTGTSVTIPSGYLSEKKKYTWNMQSSNDAGYSSHTSTWTFYTVGYGVIIRPDIPSRISPADGANNVSCRPTFSWSSTPNATSYRVWLIGGDNVIWDQRGITGTSVSYPYDLSKYTWYTWKIQAMGPGGTSDESNGWSFRTEGDPPDLPNSPVLVEPTNGQTVGEWPTFKWNATDNKATGFFIYVHKVKNDGSVEWRYKNSGFIDKNQYPNSYNKIQLEKGYKYLWSMQANNSTGYSNETEKWTFYTEGYSGNSINNPITYLKKQWDSLLSFIKNLL